MRRAVAAGIVFGLLLILLAIQAWSSYNALVRTQTQASRAWTQVDNLLKQRSALVEPTLRTLQDVSEARPDILAGVAIARDQLSTSVTREERITAARDLDASLSRLFATIESDSTWSDDPDVQRDQQELAHVERRLSIERTRYNEVVSMFNGMLQRFPTNLFANMLGFKAEPVYRESPAAAAFSPELPQAADGNRS